MDNMCTNIPELTYNKMTCTLSSVILYKQLSCIIIYKLYKGIKNIHSKLYSPLYGCHTTVLYKANYHQFT